MMTRGYAFCCFLLYIVLCLDPVTSASSLRDQDLDDAINLAIDKNNGVGALGYVANSYGICGFGSGGSAHDEGAAPEYQAGGRAVMGSLTKSMTVVFLAQLLVANQVPGQLEPTASNKYGWATPLGNILQEAVNTPYASMTLEDVAAMKAFNAGAPTLGPDDKPTTLGYYAYTKSGVSLMTQRAQIVSYMFRHTTPQFEPGSTYAYSNQGFILLGHIAEIALNTPWEKGFKTYIVDPLDLSPGDSYPYTPAGVQNWGHFVDEANEVPYACDPCNPLPYPGNPNFNCGNAPNIGPAGTYSGSILGLSKYYQWVLGCVNGDSYQLAKLPLSQDVCKLLQTGVNPVPNDPITKFGYGWQVNNPTSGPIKTYLSYSGSNGLNIATVEVYTEPNYGIVFASSNGGGIQNNNIVSLSSDIIDAGKNWAPNNQDKCPTAYGVPQNLPTSDIPTSCTGPSPSSNSTSPSPILAAAMLGVAALTNFVIPNYL